LAEVRQGVRRLDGPLSVAGAKLLVMDEADFMRGRVYGADHEDAAPRPDREYAELVGGPLDGLLLDITDRSDHELREVALTTEIGRYGPGGHALYERRGTADRRFDWRGDAPGTP
jgi:hypothetical protein